MSTAVNKTRIGLLGSDRIGLWIWSDWQFALNSKLHWTWLLVGCCTTARDSAKADRCEDVLLMKVMWRLKRSFAYWQQVVAIVPCSFPRFLERLLWKEALNLGSVKNNTNSEASRDGKKHKISAMRDTDISLRHLRFVRCHVTKPLFGNCNREYEVMQQKISQCSSVENNFLRWFSSWRWILTGETIY